jgi:hypothetical protein
MPTRKYVGSLKAPLDANENTDKNDYFLLQPGDANDACGKFRRLKCVAPLEMPLELPRLYGLPSAISPLVVGQAVGNLVNSLNC